jgi:hypothetical protein
MESKLNNMNSNKLISEFMGMEDHQEMGEYVTPNYNTSWDWLMPVVEKIEGLRDENGNAYRFNIDMCNAQIEETHIEILGGAFKIDTTYKAVVQFINQYN